MIRFMIPVSTLYITHPAALGRRKLDFQDRFVCEIFFTLLLIVLTGHLNLRKTGESVNCHPPKMRTIFQP